jgi:hypothetical protein
MNITSETKRTYSDAQIAERGREIAMEASALLLAAVRGGAALNPERVSCLSEAVHASMTMAEFAPTDEGS